MSRARENAISVKGCRGRCIERLVTSSVFSHTGRKLVLRDFSTINLLWVHAAWYRHSTFSQVPIIRSLVHTKSPTLKIGGFTASAAFYM